MRCSVQLRLIYRMQTFREWRRNLHRDIRHMRMLTVIRIRRRWDSILWNICRPKTDRNDWCRGCQKPSIWTVCKASLQLLWMIIWSRWWVLIQVRCQKHYRHRSHRQCSRLWLSLQSDFRPVCSRQWHRSEVICRMRWGRRWRLMRMHLQMHSSSIWRSRIWRSLWCPWVIRRMQIMTVIWRNSAMWILMSRNRFQFIRKTLITKKKW